MQADLFEVSCTSQRLLVVHAVQIKLQPRTYRPRGRSQSAFGYAATMGRSLPFFSFQVLRGTLAAHEHERHIRRDEKYLLSVIGARMR